MQERVLQASRGQAQLQGQLQSICRQAMHSEWWVNLSNDSIDRPSRRRRHEEVVKAMQCALTPASAPTGVLAHRGV